MPAPLINGTAYSWQQIELRLFNEPVNGIVNIEYEDAKEYQDNYGAGNRPVSRGSGKIESKGTLTLEMAEVEAIQAATIDGNITSIAPFDIVVSYLPEGGVIRTHTLKNCQFKGNSRKTKSGDMTIEVQLDLQISHILWK